MLKVNINGIEFKNPVIAASGTFGFGAEYNNFYDVGILGGISSKGLTLNPKSGNEGIRVYETPSGMMNSVGLQNPGIDRFIKEELPKMKELGTNIIANVGGGCIEDYEEAIQKLRDTDIDMIELNISCPNVKSGGMAFGIKSEVAREVVREVRAVCKQPLVIKLSPNAEDIVEMVLKDLEPKILDVCEVGFECNCSKERTGKVLQSIGEKELQAIIDEDKQAEVTCHFCNNKYHFTEEELVELLNSIK